MVRVKKTVDYINDLCSSKKEEQQALGKVLRLKYEKWMETLELKNFLDFNNAIMGNKEEIGVAQFFGKFRAYAFEEHVYRLLKVKIRPSWPLRLFWGEKCLVWSKDGKNYAMEFDVSMGRKINAFVDPVIVFDTKVELDSARLKTAIASFAMLKLWKPKAKCVLVYITKELDETLFELAKNWLDAAFQLNLENNETEAFLGYVANCF